jgi:hypothetical protein
MHSKFCTVLEIILRKSFQQYHHNALNVFRMEDFQFQKHMVDVPTIVFVFWPKINSYQICSRERHIFMM